MTTETIIPAVEPEVEETMFTVYRDGVSREVDEETRDNNYYYCNHCSDYHNTSNDVRNARGRSTVVCDDCRHNNYFQCQTCDDVHHDDNCAGETDNGAVCRSCADDMFYHESDERYHNDPEESEDDEQDDDEPSGIMRYDYRPDFMMRGDYKATYPFIGFELEIESGAALKGDLVDMVKHDFLYLKADGSLSDGFEIVSHPATLDVHQKESYQKILSNLSKGGARSHDTTTCGLHFHLSRKDMSQGHKVRLGMFFAFCQNEIETVARRRENQYARFKKDDLETYSNNDRYSALNWNNSATVEFRVFRGTLKYESFMACMEFCLATYQFTWDHRVFNKTGVDNTIETGTEVWGKFLKFVGKRASKFPFLVPYLKSKNFNIGEV